MPQYKTHQYGLKQYGLFQSSATPERISGKWQFLKSRFGLVRNGQTFWLYSSAGLFLHGKPERLRIRTDKGETLYAEKRFIKQKARQWRLRIPERETLESIAWESKKKESD